MQRIELIQDNDKMKNKSFTLFKVSQSYESVTIDDSEVQKKAKQTNKARSFTISLDIKI